MLLDLFVYLFLEMWIDRKNRRIFFEEYANKHNFDALIPSNWYMHFSKIKKIPVCSFLL